MLYPTLSYDLPPKKNLQQRLAAKQTSWDTSAALSRVLMVSVNEISVALKALWSWPELVQKSSVEGHDGSEHFKAIQNLGVPWFHCFLWIPHPEHLWRFAEETGHLQVCALPHVGSGMLMLLWLVNLEGVFVLEDLRRRSKTFAQKGVAFYDDLWP